VTDDGPRPGEGGAGALGLRGPRSSGASAHVQGLALADLLQATPGAGEDLGRSLQAILLLACASCPSCVAVSLTVDDGGTPVTVVAGAGPAEHQAASLTVRLSHASSRPVVRAAAVLVVFATDMVALARLGVELRAMLGTTGTPADLTIEGLVPPPTSLGTLLVRGLAERAAVDRALGALLEQGWLPDAGRRELELRAVSAGDQLAQVAAVVLEALPRPAPPGATPAQDAPRPGPGLR
jgi:hypothetical protein